MRKFLFIGVGGSGGATLRFIHDSISRRLAEVGYSGPFPDAWQFVQLDLPLNDDKGGSEMPPGLGASYRGIAPIGVEYDQHRRQLANQGGAEVLRDLSPWWPDPRTAPRNVWFGAGQYRAVGRMVTLSRLSSVGAAITEAHNAMSTDKAVLQLREAAQLLGFDTDRPEDQPVALVVGSMAGGTGAGGLLDVCDVLRSKGEAGANAAVFMSMPMAVLYTSDIFRGIGAAVPGAEPNSLAVMAELTAGLRSAQKAIPSYHMTAGFGVELGERGPALTFLIGAGNGEMALGNPTAVYRASGLAISTWVTDPGVQSGLQASPIGNHVQLRHSASALAVHKGEPEAQALSSFGYGRLEVSRRRFTDYAAERLGRQVIDHLLRAHLKVAAEDTTADAAREARLTPQSITRFLQSCGLSERDQSENQIIDAIESAAHGPAADAGIPDGGDLRAACDTIGADLARRALDGPAKNLDLNAAQNRLVTQTQARVNELKPMWSQMLKLGADRWCEEIQPRVVKHVTRTIAEEGLPVTVALLERADDDLEAAIGQLDSEAVQARNYARNAFGHMSFAAGGAAGNAVAKAVQGEFAKAASICLRSEVEALLRERAVSAIREFKSGFLHPMRRSLATSSASLNESWPTVQAWASESIVPSSYVPDPNVVLLTDLERYPALFEDLLARSLGGSSSGASRLAIDRVIESSSEDDGPGISTATRIAPFITLDPWHPGSGRQAAFEVALSPEVIRGRCSSWLVSDTSVGIGAYLTEPLSERLTNASPDEVAHFVSRFRVALERSAPLVEVSSRVLTEVHGIAKPEIIRTMSTIPLPVTPGQEAYDRISDLLRTFGMEDGEIVDRFRTGEGESGSADIEVSTFMRGYHPVVFSSLVTPIAAAAREQLGKGDRGFWMMRRARPLDQFVPLSESRIEQLARGWYVGRLLGMITFTDVEIFGQASVSASISRGSSGPIPLPAVTLGRPPVSQRDVFASVLESYPLAEVLYAAGDPGALLPYERLLELGLGNEFKDWIRTGELPFGVSPGGQDPESRANTLMSKLKDVRSKVEEVNAEYLPRADEWSQPPMTWELVNVLLVAIDSLIDIVGGVQTGIGVAAGDLDG